MSGKRGLGQVAKALGVTLLFFVAVELLLRVAYLIRNASVTEIPLPYMIGDEYGPVPPWADGLRILEPDERLIWKSRPNLRRRYIDVFSPVESEADRRALLRRFLPSLPVSLRANPVWEISLNSEGFRDAEFPQGKRASAYRVICLGDSWTFGANVAQPEAYPQRLGALLREEFPRADFEVMNLGVLGYSSYQGLELLRTRGIDLKPDVVLIAFAMNDARVAGYRDKDLPGSSGTRGLSRRLARVGEQIETFKLLRYLALMLKEQPKSPGHYLMAMADSAGKPEEAWGGGAGHEAADYERFEAWTRVSPGDYERNVLEMISMARQRGAGVILVRNELWDTSHGRLLEKISRAHGLPLVDSRALIAEAQPRIEEALEARLDLRPPRTDRGRAAGEIEVVFRVSLGERPVPRAVYIVGAHPKLGGLVPNQVAMYDDGTHGDQRAGDKVWSYAATFPRGARLFYVYTHSGQAGQWTGLDVPHVRTFRVEAGGDEARVYRPIESFGKIYLQADSWHTDATGYDLIAKALLAELKRDERVQRYLGRILTTGSPQ